MVCSLAAVLAAVPAFAQQPYGAGIRPPTRPVSTFATPYPSTPAPGPVGPGNLPQVAIDPAASPGSGVIQAQATQPVPYPANPLPASKPPTARPAPGPSAAPGASGRVMYFHKPANSLLPDGMVDSTAVAMATSATPPLSVGLPDVAPPPPGLSPKPLPPSGTQWRPLGANAPIEPQPYIPSPLPSSTHAATTLPVPPRIDPLPTPGAVGDTKAKPIPKEVTELPSRATIFQIPDDARLHRLIYDRVAKDTGMKAEVLRNSFPFPAVTPTVPPGTRYLAKTNTLPPGQCLFEPGFVIHNRLHFEEKNAERYGWDLGIMQPLVSTASFYKNMILWPSSLVTGAVVGFWDTNAGKCLPGSPVPYYFYPQGLTVSGTAAEGVVLTTLSFVIP